MACLVKIFLAFSIVQVAVVLAKPYEQENDDGLYRSQSDTGACSMNAADRLNCGHRGITESECEQKGCCYDNSVKYVPWCFHAKVKPPESCSFAAKDRKDCGFKDISKAECEFKGCCWDSSVGGGVPWCFKPADCGSTKRLGFQWSQRCRTSCREGERREATFDNRCSGNDICCKCHNGWYWDCELDF